MRRVLRPPSRRAARGGLLGLPRWRQLPLAGLYLSLLGFGPLAPIALADNALERLRLADGEVLLNGVGVARQLNEELYVATLYTTRPSRNPLELLDARQRRRLQLRIVADRMYPSGVARHFRDLVSLNNPRDEIVREAKNLNRFYGLFQQGLMRGDEMILDNQPGRGLVISINGQNAAEFSSPLLFDLLLRCFIGDKPPNLQFRSQLLGESDSNIRAATLARFASLQPQEERLLSYANIKVPVRESEPAEPAAAAPITSSSTAPSSTVPSASSKGKPETAKLASTEKSPEKPAEIAVEKPTVKASEPAAGKPPVSAAAAPAPAISAAVTPAASKTTTSTSGAAIEPGASTSSVQTPSQRQLNPDEISALLQRYEGQLRDRLLAGLEYPRREMKRKYGITQMARQKGKVVLRLHLDTGGDINAAWLQERTNEPIIDNAALALVDKVAPFPPLPKELPDSAYEFYVPLEFDPDR